MKLSDHRPVLALAFPMILSNLTIPMLGIVDTAVMGHLPGPEFIGGVAIGGMIFSFIFWGFGSLRMGTTGITAQIFGSDDHKELIAVLMRAAALAVIISILLLVLQIPIANIAFYIINGSERVELHAITYFDIRIWSSPAVLIRYAAIGWLLGMQNARAPLFILVAVNGINVVLDIVFVMVLHMQVDGVAWATVIAEYTGTLIAMLLVYRQLKPYRTGWDFNIFKNTAAFKRMLLVNKDIFLRTLVLIACFSFFTAKSAEMGDVILAANTILMNLLLFMSYGLDGFAHAVEALAGRALGGKNRTLFIRYIKLTGQWSLFTALLFFVAYLFFGDLIVKLQTDIETVLETALVYLPWLIVMPLVSVWAFWLDGVFVGATLGIAMRNCMMISGVIYFLLWFFTQAFGNHGMWLAMTSFMLVRGILQAWVFIKIDKRNGFLF